MPKKVWMIITIDSDSRFVTTKERQERQDILVNHGFSELSPHNGVRLPESTYIGKIPCSEAGKTKVDEIWEELKSANLEPRRILGGIINDWKILRSKKDKD